MIIFDFDLTLVDTKPVETLRAAKEWRLVMARVPELEVYDGVHELLSELDANRQRLAIVTKSPDMIPRAFVRRYGWPVDIVIGYHQVRKHKPDPEGLVRAMCQASATSAQTFHVGDHPEDTEASQRAGIAAIGAGWGSTDVALLRASNPDYLFTSVQECREFLLSVP
ncbi:HAD-IA family hydrolase [Candidatus Palauibacter polyketidifaciens]|uniref:HAD family hydrolase n=1 Tax=Candidatus Palauibacter polyketidifaciens TaxID=3056740 RepID=UPI00239BB110|nr:HAD-IA family hydrolase [Candidatus Palauibacter polyketidifaciens]MDE2721619.1 HAD-IA family hydrolase [Candidatus Palauibacter polyketidifaciens]